MLFVVDAAGGDHLFPLLRFALRLLLAERIRGHFHVGVCHILGLLLAEVSRLQRSIFLKTIIIRIRVSTSLLHYVFEIDLSH